MSGVSGKRKTSAMGQVIAVSRNAAHNFSKPNETMIELIPGLGVKGDAHLGETVQHLVRVREDPTKPNLRQVHLIHAELFDELREVGFTIAPGEIGENVTTRGIDLLNLPVGTRLRLGENAIVEVTGLRNPCRQIDRFKPGLMTAMLGRDDQGRVTLKSGIMGIVRCGGHVRPGDAIGVALPREPHRPMTRV